MAWRRASIQEIAEARLVAQMRTTDQLAKVAILVGQVEHEATSLNTVADQLMKDEERRSHQ